MLINITNKIIYNVNMFYNLNLVHKKKLGTFAPSFFICQKIYKYRRLRWQILLVKL